MKHLLPPPDVDSVHNATILVKGLCYEIVIFLRANRQDFILPLGRHDSDLADEKPGKIGIVPPLWGYSGFLPKSSRCFFSRSRILLSA